MKRTIIYLIMLCITLGVNAKQTAREILDATKTTLQKSGLQGNFTVTTYQKTKAVGSMSGSLSMSGNKYSMTTNDYSTWFDGKTQWTYMKQSDEVNVSTPTSAEIQKSSPSAFLSIYQSGYKLSYRESTLRGKKTWEVTMKATNKRQPSVIKADIEQGTYTPLCVRVLNNGDWTRISISNLKSRKFSDETFRFSKKDYPSAEVIDMR